MQTSHTVMWEGEPNAIVHLSLSNSSPIPLYHFIWAGAGLSPATPNWPINAKPICR